MKSRDSRTEAITYALAVDIGGTFTDIVLRRNDGEVWVDKVLTTYHDLLEGFLRGVETVLRHARLMPAEVNDVIVHATTIVTNALLEKKGAKTALLTTAGFSDVLYIRDEYRYDMYDLQIEFPPPLVPRELTFGVPERTRADGTITQAADRGEVRAVAERLHENGVASVAVCLLNSYCNAENERIVGEALKEALPDLYVSLSSEVSPQIREYPRTSTAVINAYTAPIARPYLERMSGELASRGFRNTPLMMLSSGGVVGMKIAGQFPVRMIESGPAAGALAASHYAGILGLPRLLSFDMGGTTAKACIIENGSPLVTGTFEVDRKYRFKAGSGYPVTVPSVDMIEIGAGGGSIASCDQLRLLKVGPQSAGSSPGPVCYGLGGRNICVTDADLALGLLDANNFLGGEMKLDAEAMQEQIQELAAKVNVTANEVAAGVYRVVGETMAAATWAHAVDKGVDCRGIPLLAFGGAGPLHACYVAELLGSPTVIIPPQASVLSAFGMLVTPPRFDLVRSAMTTLTTVDWGMVDRLFDGMVDDGGRALTEAGVASEDISFTFSGDLRYVGQANEVTVTFTADPRECHDAQQIRAVFERAYAAQYGLCLEDNEVEVVNWRVTCLGPLPLRTTTVQLSTTTARPKGTRTVNLSSDGRKEILYAVYDRGALAVGQEINGPALLEERETTTVILPGWLARVDETGCIIARRVNGANCEALNSASESIVLGRA